MLLLEKKFLKTKSNQITNIVEKNIDFNKQQKGRPLDLAKRIKELTPTQMFPRFRIAHAQVKESNISENLLNEIWKIIYYLYSLYDCQEDSRVLHTFGPN